MGLDTRRYSKKKHKEEFNQDPHAKKAGLTSPL